MKFLSSRIGVAKDDKTRNGTIREQITTKLYYIDQRDLD